MWDGTGTVLGFQENAEARAKKIFGTLDVNGDGDLTADEFVKGCLLDPELVQ